MTKIKYVPGDIVLVQPRNDQNLVEQLALVMKLDLKSCITIDIDQEQKNQVS